MKFDRSGFKVFVCGVGLAVATLAVPLNGQEKAAKGGFSFDVYGDSRSMMYLPYKVDQEAEARKLMVDMFELVLPVE